MLACQLAAVFEFRLGALSAAGQMQALDTHRPPGRFGGCFRAGQHFAVFLPPAVSGGGGRFQQQPAQADPVLAAGHDLDLMAGAALFHQDRVHRHIQRPRFHQLLHGQGQMLAGDVVQIRRQHGHPPGCGVLGLGALPLAEQHADRVRAARQIPRAQSVADARHGETLQWGEGFGVFHQQGRARRSDQFMGHVDLGQGNALEEGQGGGSRDGKGAVGALDRAPALHQRRGQDRADAQHMQPQAGAHDVGDRVHRAHFMEMHFFDRGAVDRCLHQADAPEHRNGAGFHRVRQGGPGDEGFDFGK